MDKRYAHIGSVEDRVIEECSELIQAICKSTRFGLDTSRCDDLKRTNRKDILYEIADVRRVIDELEGKLK